MPQCAPVPAAAHSRHVSRPCGALVELLVLLVSSDTEVGRARRQAAAHAWAHWQPSDPSAEHAVRVLPIMVGGSSADGSGTPCVGEEGLLAGGSVLAELQAFEWAATRCPSAHV